MSLTERLRGEEVHVTRKSNEVGSNGALALGSVPSMDEPRDHPPAVERTRLSAAHAARLLRLGAEPDPGSTPTGATAEATWARAMAPAESPGTSQSGTPVRIGRAGASITLIVVSAAGFLAVDTRKSVQVLPNRSAGDGSVSQALRPASRATPGDPGASPPNPETSSMQKQLMGSVALSAALAAGDVARAEAVQWRVEDGGNGHWYRREAQPLGWPEARARATERGGHLVSIRSQSEYAFIQQAVQLQNDLFWTGGYQDPNACEPACGWRWVTGEPWDYANWNSNEPSDSYGSEHWMECYPGGLWNDRGPGPLVSVVEWSADCNNDGVIDYGQILQGQLPDANQNGIPDSCEIPNCTSADLFRDFNVNGADLGIMLSQWGETTSFTVSDLNRDGSVDGIDLGLLLAFWGPCPG